jgi:hypothetical protein
MANTSRINGFRMVRQLSGVNIQTNLYYVPASDGTALYIGDPVKVSGDADPTYAMAPTITRAAAGDQIVGIVVGFFFDPTNLNVAGQARAASTARYALVCDDPYAVYEVETSNGTLTQVDIGLNINHAVGTPNATTANSGATVDAGTKAATATLTFKLIGFSSRVDNDPTAASSKVYVKVNNHVFNSGTGTTGT